MDKLIIEGLIIFYIVQLFILLYCYCDNRFNTSIRHILCWLGFHKWVLQPKYSTFIYIDSLARKTFYCYYCKKHYTKDR